MTNEEIEKEAARCVELTESDIQGMRNAYSEMIPCDLEARIARAIREAVSQAYEEAMKAQCPECESSTPAERNVFAGEESGLWVHIGDGYEVACSAQGIRALKDSLALEPVVAS